MAGPINWFSQIASVTKFGLLGIPQRRGSVAAAVIGIAGSSRCWLACCRSPSASSA